MHQLMEDDSEIYASLPQRNGLNLADNTYVAGATVPRNEMDVGTLKGSRNNPKDE